MARHCLVCQVALDYATLSDDSEFCSDEHARAYYDLGRRVPEGWVPRRRDKSSVEWRHQRPFKDGQFQASIIEEPSRSKSSPHTGPNSMVVISGQASCTTKHGYMTLSFDAYTASASPPSLVDMCDRIRALRVTLPALLAP